MNTAVTAQPKDPRLIQAAGQVETHFLPALVPLCQSITDLLILSIQLVLIRYRFDRSSLLYIENLALVDLW
jgi:hypothetical protein